MIPPFPLNKQLRFRSYIMMMPSLSDLPDPTGPVPRSGMRGDACTKFPRPRRAGLRGICLAVLLALGLSTAPASAGFNEGECGGDVACACGDRVVEDYTMSGNIGPCSWDEHATGDELVGLRVDDGITLDCAGFGVEGPADQRKEEFGIKIGSRTRPVVAATVRNCRVHGFWWGVHIVNSSDILVESSTLEDNGWFDPDANGTGYGIDVVDSTDVELRDNTVRRNGNEGLHLSSSSDVRVIDNTFEGNGFEQVYLIDADRNTIRGNTARGGTQGLEMRESNENVFENNHWLDAPLHWLENDSESNVFSYDHFEGLVRTSNASRNNRFENSSFWNPTSDCLRNDAAGTHLVRPLFESCKSDVFANAAITVERAAAANKVKKRKQVTELLEACNGDQDGDGLVDNDDIAVVVAALDTVPGDAAWDANADIDHDGEVDMDDLAAAAAQTGDCEKFRNRLPRASLRKSFLTPGGGASRLVRLDASRSGDSDNALVHVDFFVRSLITGESVLRRRTAPGEAAVVETELARGKYEIFITVMDRFGATSDPKRRGMVVK